MNNISAQRFNALAGYARQPTIVPITELEFYEAGNERVLGLLLFDGIDNDFAGLILGRDANGRFRCVAMTAFFGQIDAARDALRTKLEQQALEPDESFYQGDEFKITTALLKPVVPFERMNPEFRQLLEAEHLSPAKGIIGAMSPYFRDLDGNFIEQFQTSAFDARIFELYNFAMLHENGYGFDQSESTPDYYCIAPVQTFFVEAVTVQPTIGAEPPPTPKTPQEHLEYHAGYAAIKFGSALFSKLKKKYWERPHVTGKPIIFAIQDFHRPQSMMMTTTALAEYLFGWHHIGSKDEHGHLVITPKRIQEHRYESKSIPSDFFSLPGAEHISAVIHNPHATLPKFNRMGVLAGFGSTRIRLIRKGMRKDHDPDSTAPIPFVADVRDPKYSETWTEGLSVYHNPRALWPLDRDFLYNAAHHYTQGDGQMVSYTPEFFPMGSVTLTISFTDQRSDR